jgi:hypothetical protein
MLSPQELESEGKRHGAAIAAAVLGHPVDTRVEATASDYHRILHRHLHEQRMSVWKLLPIVEVVLDESGSVAGYRDPELYRGAAMQADTPENHRLAACLIADEELFPAHARMLFAQATPGPLGGELLTALVTAPEADGRRWRVEVNPGRGLIASVRPLGREGGNGD